MKGLSRWLSGSLDFTPGTIGGIKVDGTTFHHGGLYPRLLDRRLRRHRVLLQGGPRHRIQPHGTGPQVLQAGADDHGPTTPTCATGGIGIAGRHPLNKNGRIPDADVNAFGYLAALGDLTGSGKAVDPELAGAYLRLKGTDKELNSLFKKEGIETGAHPLGLLRLQLRRPGHPPTAPTGWSPSRPSTRMSGARRSTPATTATAATRATARAPIIGSGNPVTAFDSGFKQEGWDWKPACPAPPPSTCRGAELNSPLPGTLMERNPNRFSGASSLEGQKRYSGTCISRRATARTSPPAPRPTRPSSASTTGWSSLGSGIDNNNTSYPHRNHPLPAQHGGSRRSAGGRRPDLRHLPRSNSRRAVSAW